MSSYVILLRGIDVGGKNKISMVELRQCLDEQGFEDVITYIQSGNVVLSSSLDTGAIREKIESALPRNFRLDSSIIKVLPLDHKTFKEVITQAPQDFGNDATNYRYYVIFLMDIDSSEAIKQIDVHDGVDKAWQGDKVIYYRLPSLSSPNATKIHLGKMTQKPLYQSTTIRNWNTIVNLLRILEDHNT